MKDIFGSVFGRSKKSAQSSSNKSEDQQVQPENSMYPPLNYDHMSPGPSSAMFPRHPTLIERSLSIGLSPIDGVPFVCNTNLPGRGSNNLNLNQCLATIGRISGLLSSLDYNFSLEKQFLSQYQ